MIVDGDLHIHSRFSGATSPKMQIRILAGEAKKKGITILATGDCLHSQWLAEIKEETKKGDLPELEGTRFVLSTEVEDNRRVHHLLFFPSFSMIEQFREEIKGFSPNLDSDGRPNLSLSGEEIAEKAKDADVLFGPSHAFTPWTALYAYHDSLQSCYGDMTKDVAFLELGLSADTNYADRISELHHLTFVSNSDSHSPYPVRLAREFNRFDILDFTWEDIKKALLRKAGRKIVLNAGLPPQEGKYNETACINCFTHYSLHDAVQRHWKCTCGKRIKRGVQDRINELATYDTPQHPPFRPPYLHLIPLAEIIQQAIGQSSPYTKTVQTRWEELINTFKTEVNVLIDTPLEEIERVTAPAIAYAIQCFRDGTLVIHPGGGGQYGSVEIPSMVKQEKQKKLSEY